MDKIKILLERTRRAVRFYFSNLGYGWRLSWAKAGYYDGRLGGPLQDEHRNVDQCRT